MRVKKLHLISILAIVIPCFSFAQAIVNENVALSNLASNLHFDSYDDTTKIVKNLNFTVLCNGANIADITPPFTVKVYIWDGSDYSFVKTYTNNGIHPFGSAKYLNQDIDLKGLQLPAGNYRLGVFVDADSAIPFPPDDPYDNVFLANGNIVFTPFTGNISISQKEYIYNSVSVFPNPASEQINIKWEGTEKLEYITILDINGQIVKQITLSNNQNVATISTADLPSGIYIMCVHSPANVRLQRFSVAGK